MCTVFQVIFTCLLLAAQFLSSTSASPGPQDENMAQLSLLPPGRKPGGPGQYGRRG